MLLRGRGDEALPILLDGLKEFRGTGAELRVPYYLGMLGEAYTQAGRFEDAHRSAGRRRWHVAEKNDDRFQEAELHRLKGELVLAASADAGYRGRGAASCAPSRSARRRAEQGVGAPGDR